jgi:hypothetical protein
MKQKTDLIRVLNRVINSKTSKLSQKDREALIVMREKLKNTNTKKGMWKIIDRLIRLIGIGSRFFH